MATPTIAVSPLLTNLFAIGNGNSTNGTGHAADAFYIDWTAKTVANITFPDEALEFGADYFLTAGEEFFYCRQMKYDSYYSWIPSGLMYKTFE